MYRHSLAADRLAQVEHRDNVNVINCRYFVIAMAAVCTASLFFLNNKAYNHASTQRHNTNNGMKTPAQQLVFHETKNVTGETPTMPSTVSSWFILLVF